MTWHRRFFWLLLAFLPTQLGYHLWPDWAMVLGRRVDYLSPTLYLTDILIGLTVGAYLIFNLKFEIFNKKTLVFFAALLFAGLNIILAINKPVAIYKWLKVGEFVALGWYIVKTKPSFLSVVFPLSLGALYSSVIAIAQFLLQHSVGGPLWWLGERTFTLDTPGIARIALNWSLGFGHWDFGLRMRPYATFPHPNVLGGFLAVTLPLLISNFQFPISNQTKKFSMFKITTIAVGVIALLLTFSRSAIVVGLLGLLAVFLKMKPAFVIFVFFILPFTFYLLPFTGESVVVRQQLNDAAIKLWQQSPLVGVGLGNFLVKLPETLPSRSVYFLQPVHNIYLLILAETGIVGFLFSVWFLLKMFRPPFVICHLSFVILLVLGLIDHYPLTLQQGQLLLALLLALNIENSQRTIG